MDFALTFTMKDFMLSTLWILLVVIFVYILLVLKETLKVVSIIKTVTRNNAAQIDAVMQTIPGITKNAEEITGEISHDMSAFRDTVDNIAKTTNLATGKIAENPGFVSGMSSFIHVVSIGKVLYDKYFGNNINHFMENVADSVNEVDDMINNR